MIDEAIMTQGRRRLKQLLPAARARARQPEFTVKAGTALGEAQFSHLSESNLYALVIYPAPCGGWHADLLLRDMPPGVPNCMGTPVGRPVATREEAEKSAVTVLDTAMVLIETNRAKGGKPQEPVFLFAGWNVRLSSKAYAAVRKVLPDDSDGTYGSPEQAEQRITEFLADHRLDPDNLTDWPRAQKTLLLSILHIAALSGLYRYPMLRDGSPSGHIDASQAMH